MILKLSGLKRVKIVFLISALFIPALFVNAAFIDEIVFKPIKILAEKLSDFQLTKNKPKVLGISILTNDTGVTLSAPIVNFYAEPSFIESNESSVLHWSSQNATKCESSGGDWTFGTKNLAGEQTINRLTSDKSYVITCTGPGGETSQSATILVLPNQVDTFQGISGLSGPSNVQPTTPIVIPPAPNFSSQTFFTPNSTISTYSTKPSLKFFLNSTEVVVGNPVTLIWNASNVNYCTASGDWDGIKKVQGNFTTSPIKGSKKYYLVCEGPAGKITGFLNIDLDRSPPPTLNFTSSSTALILGKPISLNWSSTNTIRCIAFGNWWGNKNTSGSFLTEPITGPSNFILECTGPGGKVEHEIKIGAPPKSNPITPTIIPPTLPTRNVATDNIITTKKETPVDKTPTLNLNYSIKITSGVDSVILKWDTKNMNTCKASGAWSGTRPVNGTENIKKLIQGKTYTLTCKGIYSLTRTVVLKSKGVKLYKQ